MGWVQIWKGKQCGRTLKASQAEDKPNLENIFKSYLGYYDFESLHNSFDSFELLWKNVDFITYCFRPCMEQKS
jgi:hypothetical protein